MHMAPGTIIGLALFVFALALVPNKYKPTWIYRLSWSQVFFGLVGTVAALLVLTNPEFLALGILGDSIFFDLLALAIGLQLQVVLSRIGIYVVAAGGRIIRYINWRICFTGVILMLAVEDITSTVQRVMHHFSS